MSGREGFRVILHLQLSYDRKKYFFYVDTNIYKTIHDVIIAIKDRYLITKDVELHINDCWLHEYENVRVLQEGDIISVVESSNLRRKVKEKKPKVKWHADSFCLENIKSSRNGTDSDFVVSHEMLAPTNDFEVSIRKETFETWENKCKKKKRKREDSIPKLEDITDMYIGKDEYYDGTDTKNESEVQSTNMSNLKKKKFSKASVEFVNSALDSHNKHLPNNSLEKEPFISNNVLETESEPRLSSSFTKEVNVSKVNSETENITSVKRRRRRKCKKNSEKFAAPSNVDSFSSKIPIVESKISNQSSKHVKFTYDENGDCINTDIQNGECVVNAHPGVSDEVLTIDAAAFSKTTENDFSVPILSASTPEGSISKYGTHVTSVEALKDRNSSLPIFECKRTKPSSDGISNTQSDKEVEHLNYPLLKSSPKVMDIISFKVWKMDDHYCPSVSKYITANVLKSPEEDGLISLKILSGQSELKEPQGKFSLSVEPEDEELENIKTNDIVDLNFRDLLETRLIYP